MSGPIARLRCLLAGHEWNRETWLHFDFIDIRKIEHVERCPRCFARRSLVGLPAQGGSDD